MPLTEGDWPTLTPHASKSRAKTVLRWSWRGVATFAAIIWAYEAVLLFGAWVGWWSPPIFAPITGPIAYLCAAFLMLRVGWDV